ncbi:MAG: hypothetical protein D6681_06035 [Calditrichaeota bacterium]|nr:MAG: hypothetical protein D6681_06035 [Calditrichota bacterium]
MAAAVSVPVTPRQRTRRLRRSAPAKSTTFAPDTLTQLYELLQGQRPMVKVYSRTLNTELCFVNPDVAQPVAIDPDTPVYSSRELSLVLSMTPEELQRYHYLKTRLV